jgi:hypothetical protein
MRTASRRTGYDEVGTPHHDRRQLESHWIEDLVYANHDNRLHCQRIRNLARAIIAQMLLPAACHINFHYLRSMILPAPPSV